LSRRWVQHVPRQYGAQAFVSPADAGGAEDFAGPARIERDRPARGNGGEVEQELEVGLVRQDERADEMDGREDDQDDQDGTGQIEHGFPHGAARGLGLHHVRVVGRSPHGKARAKKRGERWSALPR
jgi:hypothetical protein